MKLGLPALDLSRVAMVQGELAIWIFIFPDRKNIGIYQKQLKICFYIGNLPLTLGHFKVLKIKEFRPTMVLAGRCKSIFTNFYLQGHPSNGIT